MFVLLLVACAESPLYNHQVRSKAQEVSTSESDGCRELPLLATSQEVSICYQIIWSEGPRVSQESRAQLLFTGNALVDLERFELWMPDMGHGSAPTAFSSGDGRLWEIRDIYFIMPGSWEISIQGRVRDSHETFSLTLPIRL